MKMMQAGLAAVLALGMSGAAMAEGVYGGVKLGLVKLDVSGADDATNGGLVLGYEFAGDDSMRIAVEGEFTTALSDGDVTGGGNWDMNTAALYAAIRMGGEAYLKLKAGVVNANESGAIVLTDNTGGSYGIGAGMKIGDGEIEAEYTILGENIDFLSIGYNIHF